MTKFDNSLGSDPRGDHGLSNVPYPGERRTEDRQAMNLPGMCETSDPPRRFPCTIVDMTSSGAQIQFASTDPIPAGFKVYVQALNVILDCRVVWRAQTVMGVEHTTRSAGYE